MNLKKRIPEPEQEMEGYKEVKNFILAHKKYRRNFFDLYELVSKDIIKNVSFKKGKILDVGCGYGGLIKSLQSYYNNSHFVGIDISKSMLKAGKEFIRSSKVKFLLMSADNLKLENETFDLIVCKDTFHHFDNPLKVLKELFRVLKKGGNIYITDLRRDTPEEIIYQNLQEAIATNVVNATQYIDSLKASYTIPEIKKMLKRLNIKNYKIWIPKPRSNFIREYGINPKHYLSASNYYQGKWILIINK